MTCVKPDGERPMACGRQPAATDRPPVFGRVEKGEYLLDFRTIRRDEIPIIVAALLAAFQH